MKNLFFLLLTMPFGVMAENHPVRFLNFKSQQHELKMAYIDARPAQPNGKTVVLLHGKNFNGSYWATTITALNKDGYRVIAPDQIGFGQSDKPADYQYSFQQLAINTKKLLDTLKITNINLLGHSMGGMLAVRFTLMYPQTVNKLILEDPIGLEDWKRLAPYASVDQNFQKELKTTFASAKKYQQDNYYHGQWKPAYDEWVSQQITWLKDPQYRNVAKVNALTSDMIFTQPVIYELNLISVPTLLIIGTLDRTAINKDLVKDPAVKAKMGNYPVLAEHAQAQIKGSQLVLLDGIGHLPHIEAFDRFIDPLKRFLSR